MYDVLLLLLYYTTVIKSILTFKRYQKNDISLNAFRGAQTSFFFLLKIVYEFNSLLFTIVKIRFTF